MKTNQILDKQFRKVPSWCIASFVILIVILEFSTPSSYVFGYLYTGAILLAISHFSYITTRLITTVAVILTLGNLWIPEVEQPNTITIANRIIAVIALAVTGWLSERIQRYERAIAQQNAKIQAQSQLSEIREDFVSTLTHDLKTPLLGAIETLKALRQGQFGFASSDQVKVFTIMIRSHQTTLQLVETLMDVYRNDIQGLALDIKTVDLMEIAEITVAQLTPLALSRQVHIHLHQGESNFRQCLWVKADEFQLKRVLMNLISNAINHSLRGGNIEIIVQLVNNHYLVKIIDDGQGILIDEIDCLFERFYQGASRRQAKGTGLGLYLSRQIIEAHGGTIWAESRQPQGALFAFRLPANNVF